MPDGRGSERSDLETLVGRLHAVPSAERSFALDPSDAARQYGLDAALLAALTDAGLPCGGSPDAPRYDSADLHYVGLRLGTARAHLEMIDLWRKSLERFTQRERTDLVVDVVPFLPTAVDPAPATVLLPGGEARHVPLRHGEVALRIPLTLTSAWHAPFPAVAAIAAEIAALELYFMPRSLQGDSELARRAGLVDCFTAAQMLTAGCLAAGHQARVANGLLISVPYSSAHYWCEVALDGRWVPLDPLIITQMHRYAALDDRAWPHHRSIGPMLAHFAANPAPVAIVTSDGEPVPTTYVTHDVTDDV